MANIERAADINFANRYGQTALFCAVREENEGKVENLIECGADVNITNKSGKTALFYAVEKENETIVEKFIECSADVNVTNKSGKTALFYAVEKENEKMIEKLIQSGADINATDDGGLTALFYALRETNEKMVDKLIECGADINATEKYGNTPLVYALMGETEKLVQKLIGCGADVNITNKKGETALFYAVRKENKKLIDKLILCSADINATDEDGETALFYAVDKENEKMVEKLIQCGADINATKKDGETVLFYAVDKENEKMVEKLIEYGADINAKDEDGRTALFYAVRVEKKKMAEKLIEYGADINATNKDDRTALFYAVRVEKKEMAEKLIECGADVNAKDKDGETALFYAVREEKKEIAGKLIECGADVNVRNKDDRTALFYAVWKENKKMVELIIKCGADINSKDKYGKSPLFYAVEKRNEKMVEKLIQCGGDFNATDKDGKTALFSAVEGKNEKMVKKLIEYGADVNKTTTEGKTALFFVNSQNCRMARMLIEDGTAQVDVRDSYSRSRLFYAMEQSLSLARYLLDKGANLYLNENCSVLTFFIEKCFFSLSEKTPNSQDGLNLLSERKEVERKRILDAIASVAFCKTLYFKPGSCDIDVDSLSELMRLAKENTSNLKVLLPEPGKSKTISEIFTMIHKERHDKPLIESRAALELPGLLIQLGANPNTTDSDGNTALHHATQLAFQGVTQQSVMEICQQLEKLNVSFHITNHQNETPLLYCLTKTLEVLSREEEPWPAVKTQAAVCRFLVEHGSSVEAKTGSGETVLHLTIKLLQQGFLKRNIELRQNISDVALELLEAFVLAFRRQDVSTNNQDKSGNTPLHLWAILQLPPGQDYDSTITTHESQLSKKIYTFKKCLKKMLKLLSESKAHLNVKNENGETPLHFCRTWTAVELLLNTGANRNRVDSSGRLPLLVAAANIQPLPNRGQFYPDVLQQPKSFWKMAVLENRLDPWTSDKHGESVMSILIEAESFDLAKGMIEFACDLDNTLDSVNSIIFSLLVAICKDKSTQAQAKTDLVQIILESRKCLVSGKEGDDSPLHLCCRNIVKNPHDVGDVHWTIAEKLLLHEADYKIPDSTGQSCLDIAEGCPKLKDLLLKPIDIDEVPLLMKWKSISKMHQDKLARVARGRLSKHVVPYWYHQECLARGSFGAVFAGINENDGREVAIKRIEKIRMQRPEDKREITNLTALVDCEQVVRYLCFFEDEHFSYIVLELMEGNLEELLNTAMQMDTKVSLCQDVVKGLQFLHEHDIIHRDLKPSNILYKGQTKLRFKLADFGLSRRIDSTGSSTSVYGSDVGTRCWIAPEVLKSTKPHSKSSDVFACGLVLHYFLTVRRHPFAPANCGKRRMVDVTETENNIIADKMEGWDDSLCPEAAHLLKTMLDGDESKRPAAEKGLCHPFFWSKKNKLDLLVAVGNQPEFECPRSKRTLPLTAVETDLETSFGTIVKYADWNDPGYVHMPAIYTEMTKRRRYKTNSVVELVRFIRNTFAHVTALPKSIQDQLLKHCVFLEYFPNLVMKVYKAVTTYGWDQTREEIKYALR